MQVIGWELGHNRSPQRREHWTKQGRQPGVVSCLPTSTHFVLLHPPAAPPGSHLALNTSLAGDTLRTWQPPDCHQCCCVLGEVQGDRLEVTHPSAVSQVLLPHLSLGYLCHVGPTFGDFLLHMTTWHILAIQTMWCRGKNTGSSHILDTTYQPGDWQPLRTSVSPSPK